MQLKRAGMAKEFLKKLATLDGAVIISNEGDLIAYGVKIKNQFLFPAMGQSTQQLPE